MNVRDELLEELKKFRSFMVYHDVPLSNGKKLGIQQVSIFDKVESHWNGSVLKFWSGNDDKSFSRMFLNSEIEDYKFGDSVKGLDILRIYIKDCDEVAEIVCSR